MSANNEFVPYDRASLEERALATLFLSLSKNRVQYAVLRNYERLPESLGARDIDIVVRSEDHDAAVTAVSAVASELELIYANYFRDERLTQFALVTRLADGTIFDLKIDLFTCCQVYGVELIPGSTMIEGARLHNGIPVVSDKVLFLDKYLFHFFVGQRLAPKYDANFASIVTRDRIEIGAVLAPILGKAHAEEVMEVLAGGRGSSLPPLSKVARGTALLRMWFRQGWIAVPRSCAFVFYRFWYRLRPPGIFLSVSGPDGSGKTTVVKELIDELGSVFGEDAIHYYHFRPSLLPRIAEVAKVARVIETVDEAYDRPHRAHPSGVAGSLARLCYYWLDYMVGYLFVVYPALVRREVVLFDRYIYDMVCDSTRSRIALPVRFISAVAHVLPRPRWPFFIRVSAEEAHRRKQELSPQVIHQLNARYGDLAAWGELIEIENDGAFGEASAAITDRIVNDRDSLVRKVLKKKNYDCFLPPS